MDKLKEKLHIGSSKSKAETSGAGETEPRESYDSELAAMTPAEREAYLKEFEEAEREGQPKKGSLLDRLISRGNKKTEDELMAESEAKRAKDGVIR